MLAFFQSNYSKVIIIKWNTFDVIAAVQSNRPDANHCLYNGLLKGQPSRAQWITTNGLYAREVMQEMYSDFVFLCYGEIIVFSNFI